MENLVYHWIGLTYVRELDIETYSETNTKGGWMQCGCRNDVPVAWSLDSGFHTQHHITASLQLRGARWILWIQRRVCSQTCAMLLS